MDDKNAVLSFGFYPDDYPNVNLSFFCDEDLTLDELVEFFKRFAAALGYNTTNLEKYFTGE